MSPVLVTGATGLLGGNICERLRRDGVEVRGLVREPGSAEFLVTLGVDVRPGDVRDAVSVLAAAEGCDGIVHAAGLLGGPNQQLDEHMSVNMQGSSHVFDAGAALDIRVVHISTFAVLDQTETVTETAAIDMAANDPYSQTKRAAHLDALARAEGGADIVIVIPSSVYGTGPSVSRALGPTSFNRVIRGAINGRLTHYPATSSVWVRAADVADVAVSAREAGERGRSYLAVGTDDAIASVDLYNLACELAGVEHRVQVLEIDPAAPGVIATYGESIVNALSRHRPVPAVDASWTRERLGVSPVSARTGISETVAWLAANDQIPQISTKG